MVDKTIHILHTIVCNMCMVLEKIQCLLQDFSFCALPWVGGLVFYEISLVSRLLGVTQKPMYLPSMRRVMASIPGIEPKPINVKGIKSH